MSAAFSSVLSVRLESDGYAIAHRSAIDVSCFQQALLLMVF